MIKHQGKELGKALYCDGITTRALGLMFRKDKKAVIELPVESRALASIHTYFMRYAIDVAWLDRNRIVVDTRKNVRPFRHIVIPKKKAKYIIEMPVGRFEIKIGHKIEFKK